MDRIDWHMDGHLNYQDDDMILEEPETLSVAKNIPRQ